jgi:hypothetical protein
MPVENAALDLFEAKQRCVELLRNSLTDIRTYRMSLEAADKFRSELLASIASSGCGLSLDKIETMEAIVLHCQAEADYTQQLNGATRRRFTNQMLALGRMHQDYDRNKETLETSSRVLNRVYVLDDHPAQLNEFAKVQHECIGESADVMQARIASCIALMGETIPDAMLIASAVSYTYSERLASQALADAEYELTAYMMPLTRDQQTLWNRYRTTRNTAENMYYDAMRIHDRAEEDQHLSLIPPEIKKLAFNFEMKIAAERPAQLAAVELARVRVIELLTTPPTESVTSSGSFESSAD